MKPLFSWHKSNWWTIVLIDEGFKNYAKFQENQDVLELFNWASEFKLLVEFSINQWIGKAGEETNQLIRSLRVKAHQWWYFLDHSQTLISQL